MFLMPAARAMPPLRQGGIVRAWTPIDVSGAGLVFSVVTALYTRIGKLCSASFILTYPATADASAAALGGFPFLSATVLAVGPVASSTAAATIFRLGAGSRQGNFFNNVFTPATNANLTGAVIRCSVSYLTV